MLHNVKPRVTVEMEREEVGKKGEEKKETNFDFKGCAAISSPQLKTIIAE